MGLEVPDDAEVMESIRQAIRAMASAQEIHYSQNMSYTDDMSALENFEAPEGLAIDFPVADTRGWVGLFVGDGSDQLCALGYGFNIPPGWTPGMVMCAPSRDAGEAN